MTERLNIGVLFGGRSCEHEVSVTSARSIFNALDGNEYNVHLIGIDKSGRWHLTDNIDGIVTNGSVQPPSANRIVIQPTAPIAVALELHYQGNLTAATSETVHFNANSPVIPTLDVVFPVLHGTFGEDGTLQGALDMAGLPYVGCGVAASALAMDKALAKKIFEYADIEQAAYHVYHLEQWQQDKNRIISEVEKEIGDVVFVKPANLGSSVGISKVTNQNQLISAIEHALQFDNKIVIELAMENCHEIECAILGNHQPQASILGEIIPGAEFYNYETKYIDDKSQSIIPAHLNAETTSQVQQLAIKAFEAINGKGLARVDFFVHKETHKITLNEINTMPGFTPISMYPQLWSISGIPYPKLIDQLIKLALENHQSKHALKRAF